MSAALTTRCHRLAESLAGLKAQARAALATELAQAVGAAVRDALVAALADRLVAPRPLVGRGAERDRERDAWGAPNDPWADPDDEGWAGPPARCPRDDREGAEPVPAVPAAAALALGASVGRWWLARHGTIAAAVGLGALTAGLGLAGGPLARAALAALAAAADLLAAETVLARPGPR